MRIFILLVLVGLTACGGPPGDQAHGTATDPNAATGFFTENTIPPETARDIRGDGVLRDADERPYGYAFLGNPLPEFTAPRVNGPDWSPRQIDKWTIIDVWGIWCGDCMADAPYAAALSQAVDQDPALDFVSIHTPPSLRRADEAFGDFGSVEAYFEEAGYSYPTVLDIDAGVRTALQIAWTPTYLLVSPDGIVRGFRTDLSVAGGDPVKDFLQDVARVQAETVVAPRPRLPAFALDGVAGIRSTTLFTQSSIEAAFPGFVVRAETELASGNAETVFHVREPGSQAEGQVLLFTVLPDWDKGHVAEVTTRSEAIRGPYGTRIGETSFGDFEGLGHVTCALGPAESGDVFLCHAKEDERNVFRWTFARSEGYAGSWPESTALTRAELVEMSYLPSSRVP
ncbi:MAG: hypothetical protein AAF829_00950 [Pseudomonadota bacterium]